MPSIEHEPPRPSYRDLLAAYERTREAYERYPSPNSAAVLEAGLQLLIHELLRPGAFELGQLVMTPGADDTLQRSRQTALEFLLRHKNLDWGDLPPEDVQENERALREGSRLFSSYRTRSDDKLWIITEWDRSVTTLLQPEEY